MTTDQDTEAPAGPVEFTNRAPSYEIREEHGGWAVTRRSAYTRQGWGVARYACREGAEAAARFLSAIAHLESDAVTNRQQERQHADVLAEMAQVTS